MHRACSAPPNGAAPWPALGRTVGRRMARGCGFGLPQRRAKSRLSRVNPVPSLTPDQVALLRAISELQDETGAWPSTFDVGLRLRQIYEARAGTYFLLSQPPWHGTAPMAQELVDRGLLNYDVGMASVCPPGEPAPVADNYALSITDAGRAALAEALL